MTRLDAGGEWRLAPAYDLTYASGPGGEHTTSIAGEGRRPNRSHILSLAEAAGLGRSEAESLIDEVVAAVAGFEIHAREVELAEPVRREIYAAQQLCLERLLTTAR